MKLLYLYCISFVLLSCASKKNTDGDYFQVFDKKRYDNYTLYYGEKDNDTLVFIGEKDFIKKCRISFKMIDKKLLNNSVSSLETTNYSIAFYYLIWDVNHQFLVSVGSESPGHKNNTYIGTYYNYPYYIDDCQALK
ncbi:hypothetical protein DVK85_03460 [Flavobacterium arcticum]|uniref:Lipoprotein n=1 Tax=Flavobacterium arcticum TaxID=1784713 RepID=A0A345H9S7_9FLAO|nr:hypothetical protein [Flavobacterium arcticum]AXG73337.1 hypothetical protein DVK85_03460 [Flavobacterium arcticum]KAF2513130.1 hypothetical protein E0W72_01515 [Flavobacterium arcticum]